MIVQRLREIQNRYGFLPDAELQQLAAVSGTPLYRIQEIASFFPHFRQEWDKPPRVEIHVCRDMACHLAGAPALMADGGLGGLNQAGDVLIKPVSCIGRCDRAPVVCMSRHAPHDPDHHADTHEHAPGEVAPDGSFHEFVYVRRSEEGFRKIALAVIAGEAPPKPDLDAAYDRPGNVADWKIDVYRTHQDKFGDRTYKAVEKYLQDYPAPVRGKDVKKHPWLCRLDPAGLLGMGGAGVPAYRKWLDVWQAEGDEKYVVINGDESEPGTFKDRELLLKMPHLVVEGVILAGLMTNATAGYIFIRHEYGEQIAAVRAEIRRALGIGACGSNVFGTGRAFPVEVFVSPGGYICGEQSALLEAMEDRRAQPRNRPPELATNGLRDKPTLVNNVETVAWAPATLLLHDELAETETKQTFVADLTEAAKKKLAEAADNRAKEKASGDLKAAPDEAAKRAALAASWYANQGRPGFKGRRFFSVSGDVDKPGVYEVPIGLTLGELVALAGGMVGGRKLKAVAASGPSGGLVPAWLPVREGYKDRLRVKLADIADDAQRKALTQVVEAGLARRQDWFDLLSIPLELNLFRNLGPVLGLRVGLMLGAGLVIYGDGRDIVSQAVNFTRFFRNESCGKCVPCRIGSQKLVDIGTGLAAKRKSGQLSHHAAREIRRDVRELARGMVLTSICGLGQVAPKPLATALEYFLNEIAPSPEQKAQGTITMTDLDLPPI
jgi:NADH:ubiquinone oxidoreductase subunit F (NADH-binding)/NADH:ubiquinone oxidoreductase subunit E